MLPFFLKTLLVVTPTMQLWTKHQPLHYLYLWYAWCPGCIPARLNFTSKVSDSYSSSCGWRWGVMICVTGWTVVPKYTSKYSKIPQCQNESKALLFNGGVISLVLFKLLGEVRNRMIYSVFPNLHENTYVTGIYGQLELFLKVWCYQNWLSNQYGFDFVETISCFFWQNILDTLCPQICPRTGHIRKILTLRPSCIWLLRGDNCMLLAHRP